MLGCLAMLLGNAVVAADDPVVDVYLLRHGKTMFNTTSQVQGWSDTPLTRAGIKGAEAAGRGLAKVHFIAAYSSDLGRARSTARIVLAQGQQRTLPLQEDERLREWNYGSFEGRPDAEMWTPIFEKQGMRFDPQWGNWAEFTRKMSDSAIAQAIHDNDPLGWAETYPQITARLRAAMQDVVSKAVAAGGGNVLVVSHGGAILSILDIFLPGQAKNTDIPNSSITLLRYRNGQYQLIKAGDVSDQPPR
ncbi:histidine phosphatase family protein [Aquitalea sp. LB_tupeE]|uniref:histidine phosphatase family protein n=1 Tax=Aquitalea sp. LB_tupeE TaxID=2748078 RepID=UPI0015BD223A|nr:histidine phosphatase family protein [Aquitalea sp. LB_tupeE]NWK77325.1 histidine phosphatase family protein [Aquitalea sp. LB_tupeE]